VPTLREFCTTRVEPWARATFETSCPKNWTWYRTGIRTLTKFKPLADARLDGIAFASHRLAEGMHVSTVNNSLRVHRRILNLAVEWGILATAAKFKTLSGERRRERVITPEEEARYLAVAPQLLASVVVVLADTGMRPKECFRLVWENVNWVAGRNGALLVAHGKSATAHRVFPMTQRVRAVLESRWINAEKYAAGHSRESTCTPWPI
jgi:integrase